MTQYQLTVDSDQLQHLFTDNQPLAHLLEQLLNQVLDAQATEQLHAQPYERTGQRNGHHIVLGALRQGDDVALASSLHSMTIGNYSGRFRSKQVKGQVRQRGM